MRLKLACYWDAKRECWIARIGNVVTEHVTRNNARWAIRCWLENNLPVDSSRRINIAYWSKPLNGWMFQD